MCFTRDSWSVRAMMALIRWHDPSSRSSSGATVLLGLARIVRPIPLTGDAILANRVRRDQGVAKPLKSSKSSVRDNSGDTAAETITVIRNQAR